MSTTPIYNHHFWQQKLTFVDSFIKMMLFLDFRTPWLGSLCQGAQMVADVARWCQMVPDGARQPKCCQSLPDHPTCHPDAARCCQPRCCQIIPDAPGCHHMMPDPARCSRMPPHDVRYCQMTPDAASPDAARCCQMLPGAARSCQILPDATT